MVFNGKDPLAFERESRYVGILAYGIFGSKVFIPSFSQLIFFFDKYIARANAIAEETGIPITIADFDDGLFEHGHVHAKSGKIYQAGSGGTKESHRRGWDENILWQQTSQFYLTLQ